MDDDCNYWVPVKVARAQIHILDQRVPRGRKRDVILMGRGCGYNKENMAVDWNAQLSRHIKAFLF